jgi:CheY-like chemotaxis protein
MQQKIKATILVVEDNPDHMQLVKTILYYSFYAVYEAWNGQEALEKAVQYKPDVILMDINIPVKDGISVLKELQSSSTTAPIPVVMLTCHPEHEELCRQLGCVDYLAKPFTPFMVETVITKVLAKRKSSLRKSS